MEIKNNIIEALNLEDITAADIDEDAPLFGSGLGLDSIDSLELIVMMERNYGIRLKTMAESRRVFASVKHMAVYIENFRTR